MKKLTKDERIKKLTKELRKMKKDVKETCGFFDENRRKVDKYDWTIRDLEKIKATLEDVYTDREKVRDNLNEIEEKLSDTKFDLKMSRHAFGITHHLALLKPHDMGLAREQYNKMFKSMDDTDYAMQVATLKSRMPFLFGDK